MWNQLRNSPEVKASGTADIKKQPRRAAPGSENLPLKLTVIVAVVVFMLAVVNELTYSIIQANAAAAGEAARTELFASAGSFEKQSVTLTEEEAKSIGEIYKVFGNDSVIGYCINVSCKGFGGDISLIVGVNSDGSVKGIKLLSHSETPGIGAVAVQETGTLLPQFVNATLSSVDNVTAVSGATISSTAVKTGVRAALGVAERLIKEGY